MHYEEESDSGNRRPIAKKPLDALHEEGKSEDKKSDKTRCPARRRYLHIEECGAFGRETYYLYDQAYGENHPDTSSLDDRGSA